MSKYISLQNHLILAFLLASLPLSLFLTTSKALAEEAPKEANRETDKEPAKFITKPEGLSVETVSPVLSAPSGETKKPETAEIISAPIGKTLEPTSSQLLSSPSDVRSQAQDEDAENKKAENSKTEKSKTAEIISAPLGANFEPKGSKFILPTDDHPLEPKTGDILTTPSGENIEPKASDLLKTPTGTNLESKTETISAPGQIVPEKTDPTEENELITAPKGAQLEPKLSEVLKSVEQLKQDAPQNEEGKSKEIITEPSSIDPVQ